MKNLLVIGGTGIVGSPIAQEGLRRGYKVCVVTLEMTPLLNGIEQIVIDRTAEDYDDVLQKLNDQIGQWDAVIDAFAFDRDSAKSTYDLFGKKADHIITISTTLVYDRSARNERPIPEEAPLAHIGDLGGYVDGKLALESFWSDVQDAAWTIVRPYHILGAGSLLGCIPEHNRDPRLLESLEKGEVLKLCDGGDIKFNYIHPQDLAAGIFATIGNPDTFHEAYNLVNPEIILAKEYYQEITKQIGARLVIEDIPMQQIWREMKGWEMTTLPHVYSTKKLEDTTGFTANIPLAKAINEAIQHHPKILVSKEKIPIHQRMNKLPRPKPMGWLVETS